MAGVKKLRRKTDQLSRIEELKRESTAVADPFTKMLVQNRKSLWGDTSKIQAEMARISNLDKEDEEIRAITRGHGSIA